MSRLFPKKFDSYVCVGDKLYLELEGFEIVARIEHDEDTHIDDDDVHNVDQNVTGCTDEQQEQLLAARQAWFDNQWFYGGVVLSVSRAGVLLDEHAASVWGCDCNYYPSSNEKTRNDYLTDYANEMISEALERGRAVLAELCACDEETEAEEAEAV